MQVYLLLILGMLFSAFSVAESSVWQIAKGDHKIYIGGTIHLLKPEDFPYPGEFDQAFEQAEQVAFEMDLDEANSPAFAFSVLKEMRFSDPSQTLESTLSPAVYKKLSAHLEPYGLLQPMQSMKPVFVVLTLTVMKYQQLGYVPGVDDYYFKQSKKQNKDRLFLETAQEQFGFLTSMNEINADQMVSSSLDEIEKIEDLGGKMTQFWKQGESDKLFELADMKSKYPQVYQVLLKDRNTRWIPKIEEMFASKKPTLILVGALHLAGEDSVLAMLEKKGYTITKAKF